MASTGSRDVLYVGTAALIWNLIGLAAISNDYYTVAYAPDTLPVDQLVLARSLPIWGLAGSLVGVVGGALGSLGLVLRKGWSVLLLALSLLGLAAQDAGLYTAVASTGLTPGPVPAILQSMVLVIAIALLVYAWRAKVAGKLG